MKIRHYLVAVFLCLTFSTATAAVQNSLTNLFTVASAVSATGAQTAFPLGAGAKTFQAAMTVSSGTGTSTVAIEGTQDGVHWDSLGTMSPSAASSSVNTSDSITLLAPAYAQYRVNVTALSGTGASVNVVVGR